MKLNIEFNSTYNSQAWKLSCKCSGSETRGLHVNFPTLWNSFAPLGLTHDLWL